MNEGKKENGRKAWISSFGLESLHAISGGAKGAGGHAHRKNPLAFDLCPWPIIGVGSGRAQSGGDDLPLIIDSKCLESVSAYDDTVNSMAVRFDRLVFTESVDGTIKVWMREVNWTNGAVRSIC